MTLIQLGALAIDGAKVKATDEAEVSKPELDLPAEIDRREAWIAAIGQAREPANTWSSASARQTSSAAAATMTTAARAARTGRPRMAATRAR